MRRPSTKKQQSKKTNTGEDDLMAELRSLDAEAFERKFATILDEMNIHNKETRDQLLKKDTETKLQILHHFLKGTEIATTPLNKKLQSPTEIAEELVRWENRPESLLHVLQMFRVYLCTSPISRIQEYVSLAVPRLKPIMVKYLATLGEHANLGVKILIEAVKCTKSFMDLQEGLDMVMGDVEFVETFVYLLLPEHHVLMGEAVRLLAAMSLVNHTRVLTCISQVARRQDICRFQRIVDGLQPERPISLKHHCLLLINALITGTDETHMRNYLRFEFNRCGLMSALNHLRQLHLAPIDVQLAVYEESKDDDLMELQAKLQNISEYFSSPEETFDVLVKSVKDTPTEYYLHGIGQCLLSITGDIVRKKCYFQLAEDFLTQMVFQKNGVDYEFNQKVFDLNLEPIIEGLVNQTYVEEVNARLEVVENKYTAEVTARSELDAKYNVLQKNFDAQKKEIDGFEGTKNELKKYEGKVKEMEKNIEDLKKELQVAKTTPQVSSTPSPQAVAAPVAVAAPPPAAAAPPPPPPPPPPPFPGAGPPPPPPGGPGCPPPPPGFGPPMASAVPQKKKYKPPKTTKRLNWNQIPYKKIEENSLWKNADETRFEQEKLFDKIIELFAAKARAVNSAAPLDAEAANKKKTKEPIVLDGKTVQNLSIFIGGLRMGHAEIKKKILQYDKEFVTESFVENLSKFLPPMEQRTMLMDYEGDPEELCDAEVFIRNLSSTPELDTRLEYMLIMSRFDEQMADIKPQIAHVTSACTELKESKKLSETLQLILLCGNFMNAGSRNEGTFGFEVTFLKNLIDTKTQDGTNFMHFLSDIMSTNFPELLGVDKEIPSIQFAMRVNEEQLAKSVSQVGKNLSNIESNLSKFSSPAGPDDLFCKKLENFHKKASQENIILLEMFDKMKTEYDAIYKYFSLSTKLPYEEFFQIFQQFCEDFNKSIMDNKRRADKAERDRLMKEKKEQEALKREQRKVPGGVALPGRGAPGADGKSEKIMDGLYSALDSGVAFQKRSAPKFEKTKKKVPDDILNERRRTMNLNSRELMSQMLKQSKDGNPRDQNQDSL